MLNLLTTETTNAFFTQQCEPSELLCYPECELDDDESCQPRGSDCVPDDCLPDWVTCQPKVDEDDCNPADPN